MSSEKDQQIAFIKELLKPFAKNNTNLAEFILDLHETSFSFSEFESSLKSTEKKFTDSFVKYVWKICNTFNNDNLEQKFNQLSIQKPTIPKHDYFNFTLPSQNFTQKIITTPTNNAVDIRVKIRNSPFLEKLKNKAQIEPLPPVVKELDGFLYKCAVFQTSLKRLPEIKSSTPASQNSLPLSSTKTTENQNSFKNHRESLPIFNYRIELVSAIKANSILLVCGSLGCGKSTQIPQYLLEEGYHKYGVIAYSQPQRQNVLSTAKRISEERSMTLGQEIGYSLRLETLTSNSTILHFFTDGALLREFLIDPKLSKYSIVIVDDIHQRTLNTDVLLMLLKQTILMRNDLKLILISDSFTEFEYISSFFNNCPNFMIPGRVFPFTIHYLNSNELSNYDYLQTVLFTIIRIHSAEDLGDILLFLPTQDEINIIAEQLPLGLIGLPELSIHKFYSSLPKDFNDAVYSSSPIRKCIIVASGTEFHFQLRNIKYIIDPGLEKQRVYNLQADFDSFMIVPISKATANARASKAGQSGTGKCFRLYTEGTFANLYEVSIPEIQRVDLTNVVLLLKALNMDQILELDFISKPPTKLVYLALYKLDELDVLDSEACITKLWRKLSLFPIEPTLSKVLIQSCKLGCSEEVVTIISILLVQNIFYIPEGKKDIAERIKSQFYHGFGDFMTLLNVYSKWKENKHSNLWCYENYVQTRSLHKAQEFRDQLVTLMHQQNFELISCENQTEKILKSFCFGLFRNIAKRENNSENYKILFTNQMVLLHPDSSLFHKQPQWLIFYELITTSQTYMKDVCTFDPNWLPQLLQDFFELK